jgi:hypothetical protein
MGDALDPVSVEVLRRLKAGKEPVIAEGEHPVRFPL